MRQNLIYLAIGLAVGVFGTPNVLTERRTVPVTDIEWIGRAPRDGWILTYASPGDSVRLYTFERTRFRF